MYPCKNYFFISVLSQPLCLFGYIFGIDGAGYDFYEDHWIPLYKERGIQWHDKEA